MIDKSLDFENELNKDILVTYTLFFEHELLIADVVDINKLFEGLKKFFGTNELPKKR